MSQSHIRVPKPNQQSKAGFGLLLAVGITLGLFLSLALVIRSWNKSVDANYLTATGRISETRIVVDHTRSGIYGGYIYYRIEAHVTYQVEGTNQDRWVIASEATAFREMLEARLAHHPQTCEIYWPPHFPENAKCRIPTLTESEAAAPSSVIHSPSSTPAPSSPAR